MMFRAISVDRRSFSRADGNAQEEETNDKQRITIRSTVDSYFILLHYSEFWNKKDRDVSPD